MVKILPLARPMAQRGLVRQTIAKTRYSGTNGIRLIADWQKRARKGEGLGGEHRYSEYAPKISSVARSTVGSRASAFQFNQ